MDNGQVFSLQEQDCIFFDINPILHTNIRFLSNTSWSCTSFQLVFLPNHAKLSRQTGKLALPKVGFFHPMHGHTQRPVSSKEGNIFGKLKK